MLFSWIDFDANLSREKIEASVLAQNQPTTVSALGRRSREPFSPKPSSKKTRSERTPRTKKIMPVNFIDKDADVQMYNDDDEDDSNEVEEA